MDTRAQSSLRGAPDIQTLQPRLRLHGPVLILIFLGACPLFFFLLRGINRPFYCGLSILVVSVLLFHFRKEYRLVHDRLTAVGVVTEYRVPWRASSRFVRFLARKFSPDVPVIKYSFVAFDMKTYTGRTGFYAYGLYQGARIAVLYSPGNPTLNHPARSFIFYSFGSAPETRANVS